MTGTSAAITPNLFSLMGITVSGPRNYLSSSNWQGAGGAIGVVNRAVYSIIMVGNGPITSYTYWVAGSNGNISLATYTRSGSGVAAEPTGGRVATTGSFACPAAGQVSTAIAAHTPNVGDYFGFSSSSSTNTFRGGALASVGTTLDGMCLSQDTAHPCPVLPATFIASLGGPLIRGT